MLNRMATLLLFGAPQLAASRLPPMRNLNISSSATCAAATDICSCSELAPGCGWCSSSKSCAPADACTTTCRECPSSHKGCRSSCRRKCVDTCSLVTSSCGCSELDGCGWCSHANTCAPYPECSTTCEECDSKCHNHQHCLAKCYRRFHAPRKAPPGEEVDGLTFPPSPSDINCAIGIFIATVLASAAGIGGGAVLVPLFTMLGEFTEHEAIPLSIATVFGASAFSTLGNFLWVKHPLALHRPMIAYDAALVLLPPCLLGSTGGVFLNKICPNWMIVALLVALCAYSGKRTLGQAYKRREKEDRDSGAGGYKSLTTVEPEKLDSGGTPAPEGGEVEMSEASPAKGSGMSDSLLRAQNLEAEIAAESGCAYGALASLAGTWLIVMGLSMLKGGHGAPSLLGVSCGTPGYWAVVLVNVPVLGFLTMRAGKFLVAQAERRKACGYQYVDGDVEWDNTKVLQYSQMIGFGAIAAGMLGVGGGMILGPIFNELSFHPQVSSATSTIMVFFMSSANVGQFVVFGMLDFE